MVGAEGEWTTAGVPWCSSGTSSIDSTLVDIPLDADSAPVPADVDPIRKLFELNKAHNLTSQHLQLGSQNMPATGPLADRGYP